VKRVLTAVGLDSTARAPGAPTVAVDGTLVDSVDEHPGVQL
jgi:hypothetical protein